MTSAIKMLAADLSHCLLMLDIFRSANSASNELWTALAEKAYVQINEMGWLRSGLPGNGQNSYSAIEGGYIPGPRLFVATRTRSRLR